ncbi:MAG: hypothetical protein AABZ74_18960 [Cyanobacteriota bacterium]
MLEKRYEWQNSSHKVDEIAERVVTYAKVKDEFGNVIETLFAHRGIKITDVATETALANINSCTNIN